VYEPFTHIIQIPQQNKINFKHFNQTYKYSVTGKD